MKNLVIAVMAVTLLLLVGACAQSQQLLVSSMTNPNTGDGEVDTFTMTGASLGTFASGLVIPQGLAQATDGTVFVGDWYGTIHEYAPNGTPTGTFGDAGYPRITGMAWSGADSVLWVNSTVYCSTKGWQEDGTPLPVSAGYGEHAWFHSSITDNPPFDVVVGQPVDGGRLPIYASLADGSVAWWDEGQPQQTIISGLNNPTGLALDGDNLYVATQGDGTIHVYNLSTKVLSTWLTGLSAPNDLLIYGGELYVADQGLGQVRMYNLSDKSLVGSFAVTNPRFMTVLVPEPSTLIGLLMGGVALAGVRRRRR